MKHKHSLPFFVILCLVMLSFSAAFYKFVYLKDFTTVFYQKCDPETQVCFAYIDGCEEGQKEIECADYYTFIVVNNHSQIKCENDGGECLELFCQEYEENCQFYSCQPEVNYNEFGVYDTCQQK